MSSSQGGDEADDLKPTFAEGFKLGEKKASRLLYTSPATVDQYAQLDANDESLARWKASLGITPGGAVPAGSGPKVTVLSLTLISASLPAGRTISLDLTNSDVVTGLKDKPVTIKEGIEYNVGITFRVNRDVISGLRYMHVVKRAGIRVDKMEQMIGSFGPRDEPYSSTFPTEESPSGMIARSGTYNVKSRVVDDDNEVFADFEWSFKLGKEW